MAKVKNPAAIDKQAPQTEARNAARLAEQEAANAEQPVLVQPDEPIVVDSEKSALEAILRYLDTFPNGGRTDFWLIPIRKYAEDGLK